MGGSASVEADSNAYKFTFSCHSDFGRHVHIMDENRGKIGFCYYYLKSLFDSRCTQFWRTPDLDGEDG